MNYIKIFLKYYNLGYRYQLLSNEGKNPLESIVKEIIGTSKLSVKVKAFKDGIKKAQQDKELIINNSKGEKWANIVKGNDKEQDQELEP